MGGIETSFFKKLLSLIYSGVFISAVLHSDCYTQIAVLFCILFHDGLSQDVEVVPCAV